MKTELRTQGSAELNRLELTEILRDYLKERHNFNLTKATYKVDGHSNVTGVVMDVVKTENDAQVEDRNMAFVSPASATTHLIGKRLKKHQRVNMGIFNNLRLHFESERKKGTKQIPFNDLFALVRTQYPTIKEEKLSIYLYDKRQLPGIEFSRVEGIVKIK